jgi:hypothetical protein
MGCQATEPYCRSRFLLLHDIQNDWGAQNERREHGDAPWWAMRDSNQTAA